MKILFLVRHAKSSHDDAGLSDRDRPLNDRGRRDAPTMGERLAGRGVLPQLVVSSPALRALSTAHLVADAIGIPRGEIVVDERLYASSVGRLLEIVRGLDEGTERVMLVGHNPEFTELAHRLAPTITDMPTCAVAEFRFAALSWQQVGVIEPGKVTIDTPKD
jgi:phosphohistidine phosphatase